MGTGRRVIHARPSLIEPGKGLLSKWRLPEEGRRKQDGAGLRLVSAGTGWEGPRGGEGKGFNEGQAPPVTVKGKWGRSAAATLVRRRPWWLVLCLLIFCLSNFSLRPLCLNFYCLPEFPFSQMNMRLFIALASLLHVTQCFSQCASPSPPTGLKPRVAYAVDVVMSY